jgi:hypothetical protein
MTRSNDSPVIIPRGPMSHSYIGSLNCSVVFLDPCLTLKSQMWSYHLLTIAHLALHFILLESCAPKLFWLSSTIILIRNCRKLALFMHKIGVLKVLTQHAGIESFELRSVSSTTDCASLSSFYQISLAFSRMNSNLRSFFFLNEYLYSIRCYNFLEFVSIIFHI